MSGYEFEGVDSHEDAVRISGRIKWFDAGKGYGFIVPDDPGQTDLKDVLLHVTSLRNSGRENALEGAIIASIPPDEMASSLAVMLPAMNLDDRATMLGGMRQGAPAEVLRSGW